MLRGMTNRTNAWGQPIDFPVQDWTGAKPPPRTAIDGRYCKVEPIDPSRHAAELYEAVSEDREGRMWTYMAYGPFPTLADYEGWIGSTCLGDDPLFFAIVDAKSGHALGVASLQRIDPKSGVMEVGHIHYSPALMRTRAATEAMYLLMRRAFAELGYRRYEWKCDALNEPSRRAAQRLGFTFEGIFRQATVYKGRNRDTAWFSVLDREWPALDRAYTQWLDTANFDEEGKQRRTLAELIAAARV
jgi:RimJ/RimL family protein N-acetyltransferase